MIALLRLNNQIRWKQQRRIRESTLSLTVWHTCLVISRSSDSSDTSRNHKLSLVNHDNWRNEVCLSHNDDDSHQKEGSESYLRV